MNSSNLLNAPAIEGALILTGARIFDRPGSSHPVSPLTIVGGLSLLQRTIMTLQRGGITRCVVIGSTETEALRHKVQDDRRIQIEIRWLPIREFPPHDPRTWEALSGMLGPAYLVAGSQAVFPASLVSRVRAEGRKGEPVVVVRDPEAGGPLRMLSDGVETGTGGGPTLETTGGFSPDVDLVAVTEGVASWEWMTAAEGPNPLHAALERGARQGQVRVLPLGADWYQEVLSASDEDVAQAESTLLRSLKGGLEGFVDRHFNRKCSKWLTLGLLHTPLTPNGVTVLATLVGLLAATAFAWGGYAAGIVGALLFQLSAILDCCDGEVARLKFLETPFGAQLDIALDNVVHIGLYVGMAWAAFHLGWGAVAWLLAGLATFGNLAAFVVVQKAERMKGSLAPASGQRVETILNRLASRDFSIIILALALLGHVEWFLVMAALGSNIFWPVLAWHLRSETPN